MVCFLFTPFPSFFLTLKGEGSTDFVGTSVVTVKLGGVECKTELGLYTRAE